MDLTCLQLKPGVILTKPLLMGEEALCHMIASFEVECPMLVKENVRGPVPYAAIQEGTSLESILNDHFRNVVDGLNSIYQQIIVRELFGSTTDEKKYLKSLKKIDACRPFYALAHESPVKSFQDTVHSRTGKFISCQFQDIFGESGFWIGSRS